MSVYVDPPIAYAREPRGYVGRARIAHRWAHMIADAEAELHAMAQAVGLRREWCQGDHYDLVPSRRALAVRLGAVALDRRAFGAKLRQLRTGAREQRRRSDPPTMTDAGLFDRSTRSASTSNFRNTANG